MSLRVVFGAPADGRCEDLLLDAAAPAGLALVRTRSRVRALEHTLVRHRGVAFGGAIATLTDLVRRLAASRRTPRRVLADDERMVLIADLVRDGARPPLRGLPRAASWLAE